MAEKLPVDLSLDELSVIIKSLESTGANTRDLKTLMRVHHDPQLARTAQAVHKRLLGISLKNSRREHVYETTDVLRETYQKDPIRVLKDENAYLIKENIDLKAKLRCVVDGILSALDEFKEHESLATLRRLEGLITELDIGQ